MIRDATYIYCRKYYSYTIEKLLKSIFILFIVTIILPAVTYATTPVIVAGNGSTGYSGDDGPATSARLWSPWTIDVDSNGNLFIADTINHRIRRVDAITQVITTVAGNGSGGTSGDGSAATSASIGNPHGLAVDSNVNLFFADTVNNNIRRVGAITNIITTVANLNTAFGVAVDNAGNLFIADTTNNQILRVDAVTNTITTAVSGAGLSSPYGVDVDSNGNLYIADTFNSRIIRVDAVTGLITTIVNNPGFVFDLSIDEAGNTFYVTWNHPSSPSHGIWKWDINTGTSSMLTTIPNGQGIGIGGSDVYVTSNNAVYKLAGVADAGNLPPEADAGPDQTVECTSPSGTSVILDGSSSTDPDGDLLTYTWDGPFGMTTGVNPTVNMPMNTSPTIANVTLTVSDGTETDTDDVFITVQDTTPPAITAPDNVSVEQASSSGTSVTLGTPTVSDNCHANPTVTNDAPEVFPRGETIVSWTATDASGNFDIATQTVTVVDTTAPKVRVKLKKKRKSWFRVKFSATDMGDTDLTVVALLNGIIVTNGQLVKLIHDDNSSDDKSSDDSSSNDNDKETFKGSKFTLKVTATDDSGNVGTGTDTFSFPPKRYRGDHRKFKKKLKKLKKKWRKRYSNNNGKGAKMWRKWRKLRKKCRHW